MASELEEARFLMYPYEDADKLVNDLSARGSFKEALLKHPGYRGSRDFFFRGQKLDSWCLLPGALRKNDSILLLNPDPEHDDTEWVEAPLDNAFKQVEAEAKVLWLFVSRCDDFGITVPEDGQALRRALLKYQQFRKVVKKLPVGEEKDKFERSWPPPEVLSVMALAQHSGLPTRLLDFTVDPLVAAYFAVHRIVDKQGHFLKSSERLAIWCIPDTLIRGQNELAADCPLTLDWRIQVVTAPSCHNRNLRAQKGLFLYDQMPSPRNGEIQNPNCLTEVFQVPSQRVIKITFPHAKAHLLLDELNKLKYSAGELFPSCEGVVQEMQNHRMLQTLEKENTGRGMYEY